MAKRQADKQLTDRNCDESDDEDNQLLNGPSKTVAPPDVISKRQIRALPGRNSAKLAQFTSAVRSKFEAQAFGQASPSGQPVSTGLFGASKSSEPPETSLFASPSAASTNFKDNFDKLESQTKNSQALIQYYASLRGLNLSVMKAFHDLTQCDAFTNLSHSFDTIKVKYDQYRCQIQSELDQATSSNSHKPDPRSSMTNYPSTITNQFSFAKNHGDKPTGDDMPASNDSSSVQTRPQLRSGDINGSVPRNPIAMTTPSRPSPLRYENMNPPTRGESPDPSSKINSNVTSTLDGNPATSLFARNNADQHPKPVQNSANASFATLFNSKDVAKPATSVFGMAPTSTSSTSVFGAEAPKPFSFVSTQTQSSAGKLPNIGFGFGVSGATNSSIFGGFGTTTTNATQATPPKNGFNPVGFSFGNSPPTSTLPDKIPDSVHCEKKAIGNKSITTFNDDVDACGSNPTTNTMSPDTLETTERSAALPGSNQGEEDEETLYETTGRVYALMDKKQDDGSISKGWIGWAVCNVKLNRHKTSKKPRIFARSTVNQSILVNFFLRPNFKPENRGNSVEIFGTNLEGTGLQGYRFRPNSEQIVEEFLNVLKKVIESL